MLIHDAATAWVAAITAALSWAGATGAALAFVLCVVALAAGPLVAPGARAVRSRLGGPSWARGRVRAASLARGRRMRSYGRLSPLMPQRGAWRGRGAPQAASRSSRDAEGTPEPAGGRTARRAPAWVHTDHQEAA
jgi:hypothetical protein